MSLYPNYLDGHMTQSVNLKTTGKTKIVPSKASQKYLIRSMYVIVTAVSGGSAGASISILGPGDVAISAPLTIDPATPAGSPPVPFSFTYTATFPVDVGSGDINVSVDSASDATVHNADVVIEGYYRP